MDFACVAVRDRSAEFFFPPFFVRTKVDALRAFTQIMNQPERAGAASEYELVVLATFDDQTGQIVPEQHLSVLANGADVVKGV